MRLFAKLPVLILCIFLASCAATPAAQPTILSPTETPASTATPDPCSKDSLPESVGGLNRFMREFDDYTAVASNVPVAELVKIVPELQRVRREAQDYPVPTCLYEMKNLQLLHMEVVIKTLLAFMSSGDAALINQGAAQARQLHDQYDLEVAHLLGITPPPQPAPTVTSTPPS